MRRLIFAVAVASFLGGSYGQNANAGGILGGVDGLDPGFCRPKAIRQTVVYVDDMMMIEGKTDWAIKLSNKLKATFVPGERATVVQMSPATGQSHEVWSGCWPGYTSEERAKLAKGSMADLFRRAPLDQLTDQQRFFTRDFGAALSTIYDSGKRPANTVRIDIASAPKKEILRSLSADEGRFAHSDATIRAVIYSDMAENSDLGSVYKIPAPPPESYGKKLGTYLRRSVFYAFGVGEDIKDGSKVQDNIRAFWGSALRSMSATVGGMGVDLNIPNVVPVLSHAYAIKLDYDGQQLEGRLSLLVDADGALVDSWIGISRLTSVSLNGFLRCQSTKDDGVCRLDASTTSGLVSTSPSEEITLSGSERTGFSGQLGVKGSSAMFALRGSLAED